MRFHGISIKRDSTGLARVFGEHAAIFEAIRVRDVVRARDLMRIHLNGSRERLFERRRPAEEELAAE
jgi:GntR family transcriptional repressor for pyruvate dehydrogenase complex